MDGFGIFDNFTNTDTFDLFGGSSGTLNPTTTSSPLSTTSAASTTSGSSGSGGSDWGGFFSNALDTGLNFLGGLAQIDLFGRAQNAGLGGLNNQTGQTGGTQTGGTQTGGSQSGGSGSNSGSSALPKWVMPVGIAVAVFVGVLLVKK